LEQSAVTIRRDTLYYDGECPLCTAEVCRLKKHAGDNLTIKNVHDLDSTTESPSKDVLLKRLHLKTSDGEWLVGVDANVRAWHHTPYARFWRVLNWPFIRLFSRWGYEIWLAYRQYRSKKQP
jgi:predicted DCC family thiol-disulfide oxidoreductase YuxK